MTATGPQIPLEPRPPQALVKSTAHLLKHLGFMVKERYADTFESAGVAPAHYSVLALLDEDPRETQAQIADALGYDRSHLVGILDELEERGHIERRRDPEDRRRHLVSLTPEGKQALRELRALVKRIETDFFAPLDDTQRRTLHDLLYVLAAYHEPRYRS